MENPERVEEVFQDYKGRRTALIQALTSDVEEFRKECDPGKEKLCLYGLSSGSWDVNLPVEEVPPELPEPILGINLIRDGMQEKDWISLIANHSDAWLLSVAFYIAARLGFNKATRNQLFGLINSLPTVSEAVRNAANKKQSGNKEMSNSEPTKKRVSRPQEKFSKSYSKNEEEEVGKEGGGGGGGEEDEDEESLCGICEQKYEDGEFWICCDKCGKWFHGNCVKVTPAKAVHIKHYKCPSCSSNKKARTR